MDSNTKSERLASKTVHGVPHEGKSLTENQPMNFKAHRTILEVIDTPTFETSKPLFEHVWPFKQSNWTIR